MSIANEIERISGAKADLKLSLEKRGATVGEDTLDTFSAKMDSLPYCVKVTFTPQEDAAVFELSGLNFTPEHVLVYNTELYNSAVELSVNTVVLVKNGISLIRLRDLNKDVKFYSITVNSYVVEWKDNGCVVTMPSPESNGYFKAGYTYSCVCAGGAQ